MSDFCCASPTFLEAIISLTESHTKTFNRKRHERNYQCSGERESLPPCLETRLFIFRLPKSQPKPFALSRSPKECLRTRGGSFPKPESVRSSTRRTRSRIFLNFSTDLWKSRPLSGSSKVDHRPVRCPQCRQGTFRDFCTFWTYQALRDFGTDTCISRPHSYVRC